ncbi:MAG: response regulator [Bacteroidota bacterium]|nr:response regulator [Bacteroidota bacterium]
MNKKILLIEDNIDMRENTAEILQLANYNVITAVNGREGVELAEKEKPDLIICDIMMPVLDGYGVLHLLSKNESTAGIPFIYLTAKAERSDLRKGMEMGADDYLTKPFDDIELLNAIESRLKKSEILKKDFSKSLQGLNEFFNEVKGIDVLKKLSEESEVRVFKKKEEIYKENNYPKGIYFLSSGKIKTHKLNDQGKELITGLYKEGDFFGYLALLDDGKYSDSATAMEDAEVCLIPKDDFHALVYKNSEVSRKFIKMLSNNLREKEEQLVKLAYNSVRKKVADALITLYNRYKKDDEKVFSISISREDLANLAGIATESTIRTLSDLKDEKLIDIHVSKITILNYEKLARMHN